MFSCLTPFHFSGEKNFIASQSNYSLDNLKGKNVQINHVETTKLQLVQKNISFQKINVYLPILSIVTIGVIFLC